MTIRELYEWAKRRGIEDYTIALRPVAYIRPSVKRPETEDIKVWNGEKEIRI